MQRIKDFITRLTTEGVQVIVITDIPDQFEGNEKVFVVRDWNDSWQMVDIKVGRNRRILKFDDLSKKNIDLDGL
jgi:hypothetical protein